MRYVGLVVLATAALMLAETVADAASKKHPRYVRPRAPAVVVPAPSWDYGPAHVIRPRAYVPPYTCIQDEGYGRWTYCGQGRS
jgi:hypothetical protein